MQNALKNVSSYVLYYNTSKNKLQQYVQEFQH